MLNSRRPRAGSLSWPSPCRFGRRSSPAWFLASTSTHDGSLGSGLGMAGLVALGWPLVLAGEVSLGLVLAFLAAMCWAAGTVLLKRFPSEASPLAFATWQLVIGAGCAA